jgi:hypothetical protein
MRKYFVTFTAVISFFAVSNAFSQNLPVIKSVQCKDQNQVSAPVFFSAKSAGSGLQFNLGNIEEIASGQNYMHVTSSGQIVNVSSPAPGMILLQGSFGTELKVMPATGAALLSGLVDVRDNLSGIYNPVRVTNYKMKCVLNK